MQIYLDTNVVFSGVQLLVGEDGISFFVIEINVHRL